MMAGVGWMRRGMCGIRPHCPFAAKAIALIDPMGLPSPRQTPDDTANAELAVGPTPWPMTST